MQKKTPIATDKMLVKIVNRLRSFLSSCHHGHHVIISCHHYFQHCHEDTHEQHSLELTGLLYVLRSYLPLSLSVTGCPQFAVQRFVRPDVWSGRSGVIIDEATVMRAGLRSGLAAYITEPVLLTISCPFAGEDPLLIFFFF